MNKEEVLAKLKEILTVGLFVKEDSEFELSTEFGGALGLDSLDKVEMKLTIEDEFEIELPEDSFAGDVITVEDAVNLVLKHVD